MVRGKSFHPTDLLLGGMDDDQPIDPASESSSSRAGSKPVSSKSACSSRTSSEPVAVSEPVEERVEGEPV